MEGGGRIFTLAIVFLNLIPDLASAFNIIQGPTNATVLVGASPSFSCIFQVGWKSITWYLSDVYAVGITPAGTTIMANAPIVATNSTDSTTSAFNSTITILHVNKTNSVKVSCNSLSSTPQDAYLSVQVKGSVVIAEGSSVTVTPNSTVTKLCIASGWHPAPTITWEINSTAASSSHYSTEYSTGADDLVTGESTFTINPWGDTNLTCLAKVPAISAPESAIVTITVRDHVPGKGLSRTDIILIAVFVTIGGLLILGIIIAIIVICCKKEKKKKKETGYQSDTWKAPPQDSSNLRNASRTYPGEHINRGFTPEPLSVAPNFRSNQSESSYSEAPSIPRTYPYQARSRDWVDDDHLKKIRHVTHV